MTDDLPRCPEHSANRYVPGCDGCRAYQRARVARQRQRVLADPRSKHGTRVMSDAGCPCLPCRQVRRRTEPVKPGPPPRPKMNEAALRRLVGRTLYVTLDNDAVLAGVFLGSKGGTLTFRLGRADDPRTTTFEVPMGRVVRIGKPASRWAAPSAKELAA